ncbi:MAG: CheR family methyltransferase [Chloroflexota bacterium]
MIKDAEGVRFLQWCLPRLHLRWPGFRKVRRQVFKRINRRLRELGLPNISAYSGYLEAHREEWDALATLCWISISRFYRDQAVFQHLEREILPELARTVIERGEKDLRCWSAGCSGGEEPYTLSLIWRHCLAKQFPALRLRIIGTDVDPAAIQRAERACYPPSSLKQLPAAWRTEALVSSGDEFCLKDAYRDAVTFLVQDLRERTPDGLFELILCRNLVFTYFDEISQRETLVRLTSKLAQQGALVIGKLESLPEGKWEVEPWLPSMGIYRKFLA